MNMNLADQCNLRFSLLFSVLLVSACTGPAIDDWPPKAPPVPEAIIEDYVARYTADFAPPPVYDADDLRALSIILGRRARKTDTPELPTLYKVPSENDVTEPRTRSANEINTIERRVRRKYESRHDRRHELRAKYGL